MSSCARPRAISSADRALLAASAIVLGYAIQIRDGFYDPVALGVLALAILLATAGLTRRGAWLLPRAGEPLVAATLGAGLISSLLMLATTRPAYEIADPLPSQHPWYLAGLAMSGALLGLIAIDDRRRARVWFPALLVTFALLGTWLLHQSPSPRVDVITVQEYAVDAVVSGRSPYSMTFRNIYDNAGIFYAPGSVSGARVQFGLPYPPLSLLMILPAELLLKDVRYAQLLALIAAAVGIGYSSRGRVAPLAAALLLFTPRTFFVLEQGWTESLALCWLALTCLAAVRRWDTRGPFLGLLLAIKQHMAIALLFAPWFNDDPSDRRETFRRVGLALLIAALVTVPFVLLDPRGFWHSAVALQFHEPFRTDSLSVLSLLAHQGWTIPSAVLTGATLAALAAGIAVAFRFAPRTPAGAALALGFTFLLMFAFSKKAFCNYYFFVIGALVTAVAADRSSSTSA
ncbi:MAG TPA: glycosyltransferase 87 family protein [Vicinamibacterales bacterium]